MNRLLPASAWLLVMVLAMSWLSPNHYAPWTAFHSELWSACSMLSIAVVVIHRCRDVLCFPPSLVVVFFALTQVFLGWCSGLIVAGGIAWMSGLYLVGLAGVICLGAIWQSHADGEAAEFLFAAVVLSALVSVVLQVFQLVMPAIDAFWFNPAPRGLRMDANLAQPNNLASLQLMGLIGCSWLWFRKKITTNLALLCAFILVAGLVLTGSRTGLIGGFVILIAYPSFLARQPLRSQATFIASLLGIWCVVLLLSLPFFFGAIDAANIGTQIHLRDVRGDARVDIWRLAINAIAESPWWGYGWGQIHIAQMAVALNHAPLSAFNSAHNIIVDLSLWGGLPMAISTLGYGLWRCWKVMIAPMTSRLAHTLMALGILTLHSMLELPLHYAYFLLPFGLLWGTLEATPSSVSIKPIHKKYFFGVLAIFAVALFVTAEDYLQIERAEKILRLESVRSDVVVQEDEKILHLKILQQYEDFFILSRLSPSKGLSEQQLDAMELIVLALPSDRLIYNMAANLMLNQKPERAERWIKILCKTRSEATCSQALVNWRADGFTISHQLLEYLRSELSSAL